MKKLVAFLSILFASILCTACINNFAVQELNNKAKEYLDAGDIQSAICRLQSSVDLDGNIYETRYNLAIAYIKNHDYKNAKEQIETAMKLKPENTDVYYSLGVINEGMAYEIIDAKNKPDDDDDDKKQPEELNKSEIELVIAKFDEAVKAYTYYLEKNPEATDKKEILSQIEQIKSNIEQYQEKLQTAPVAPDSKAPTSNTTAE